MPNEKIECVECLEEFPFTEGEQARYAALKANGIIRTDRPKRCYQCRLARKKSSGKRR